MAESPDKIDHDQKKTSQRIRDINDIKVLIALILNKREIKDN